MEMIQTTLRVELSTGKSILVLRQVSLDHLAKGVVPVAGILHSLMIAEGDNTAKSVMGIE
jgi:hypothetical protein